jgi:hypothetical protein
MSTLSKVKSEFLSIKVTQIKNPCKTCLVKSACIIDTCAAIRDLFREIDHNNLVLTSIELAHIIDAVHNIKLNLHEIMHKANQCNNLNFYFHKRVIREHQKAIVKGEPTDKENMEFLINEYKRLKESTKKIDV